jgi:NAD(P)-dependent dehydrogenase (short-subunit alcohol dehydrogenase family)
LVQPSRPLVGQIALVTGGARGIGRAVTETLAQHGLTVIMADAGLALDGRPDEPDLAEKVATELQAQGLHVIPYGSRLRTAEDADRLVGSVEDQAGPVDILVNNAAILQDRMVFNLPPSSWDEVIQNNLSVPFYLLRRVAPSMRERRRGRIVNILSSAGLIGNYGQANYAAAKAGLYGLTRVAALDLARYTVTVNAVVPFAHTRVTEAIVPRHPAVVEYLATIKGRASPTSVAAVVAYLCSEAAAVLTGQTFGVRGQEVFVFPPPRPAGVIVAAGSLSPDVMDEAVQRWEAAGLLTPLETDLMVMSKPLSDSSTL